MGIIISIGSHIYSECNKYVVGTYLVVSICCGEPLNVVRYVRLYCGCSSYVVGIIISIVEHICSECKKYVVGTYLVGNICCGDLLMLWERGIILWVQKLCSGNHNIYWGTYM